MKDAFKLEVLLEACERVLPDDIERLIVLAGPGGVTTICHSSKRMADTAPEVLGTFLKGVCEQFDIDLWDALRRVADAVHSRERRLGGLQKATIIARLRGGPLDGHFVELCEPMPSIRVPYAPTGDAIQDKLVPRMADYTLVPDEALEFGTEVDDRYGRF